jgi:hypothetical protein
MPDAQVLMLLLLCLLLPPLVMVTWKLWLLVHALGQYHGPARVLADDPAASSVVFFLASACRHSSMRYTVDSNQQHSTLDVELY